MNILKNWYMYPIVYFSLTKRTIISLITKSGFKLNIRNVQNSTDIHIFTEIWIENIYKKKNFDIKNNDIIIDIGANIGLFSLWAYQFCKKGQIYCYEPNNDNFIILEKNILENNLTNISAFKKIVSNTEGIRKLYQTNDFGTNNIYGSKNDSIDVQSITLEKIFDENKISNCSFLKMDCEGAEYEILLNLPESFFTKINKICLEYHNMTELNHNVNDLIKKLKSYKFIIEIFPTSEQYGILFAQRD
jgi:FkbM family methyltransferase